MEELSEGWWKFFLYVILKSLCPEVPRVAADPSRGRTVEEAGLDEVYMDVIIFVHPFHGVEYALETLDSNFTIFFVQLKEAFPGSSLTKHYAIVSVEPP